MGDELRWAGVDTSTRTFSICIIDRAGRVVTEANLPADAAAAHVFLSDQASTLAEVALETGTTSIHLARELTKRGYAVSVYDAFQVHRFLRVRLNKTDANDARGLAEIARIGGRHLRRVFLKPLNLSVLRSQLVIRERLIRLRKLNEAGLMSLLHAYGVRADERVYSQASLQRVVTKMVRDAERVYDAPIRELVMPLMKLSIQLPRDELRLENDLKAFATKDEVCRRLMEIPGVGVITAVSFITAIGDPSRFQKSQDVGAYLGLTPKVWRTGKYTKKRGISKIGNNMTRKHLHIAATAALNSRTESALQTWARELAARSNRKKAIVGLARKMAVVMLTIWKSGSRFNFSPRIPQPQRCG